VSTAAPRPLLEVKGVSKFYRGDVASLHDASFSVGDGEFVSIIGRSGAGKSTLLRCINRMIEPSGGEIVFDGLRMTALRGGDLRRARSRIGMVFQHHNLVDRLTVVENVLHGRLGHKSTLAGALGLYSRTEKAQALRVIEMLGLWEQRFQRCDQLSGGQKQRVGIARALVQEPRLILCDEPIAALDPSAAKVIMDRLRAISQHLGITIVTVLQQVDVARIYSDRILGVQGGRIVFDGSPRDLTGERVAAVYGADYEDLLLGAAAPVHAG
jgi:phosphonate transport system ATP-binding protein